LKDQQALSQSFACEKEAENLFKAESEHETLPTLAGIALLHLSLVLHGNRSDAIKYIHELNKTMIKMKLFDDVTEMATNQPNANMQETLLALCGTAWGIFNMMV
jgi:hypothetical protein